MAHEGLNPLFGYLTGPGRAWYQCVFVSKLAYIWHTSQPGPWSQALSPGWGFTLWKPLMGPSTCWYRPVSVARECHALSLIVGLGRWQWWALEGHYSRR